MECSGVENSGVELEWSWSGVKLEWSCSGVVVELS